MLPITHPERLQANQSLSRYTAARLGGAAEWLYVARESTEELAAVVQAGWDAGMPVRVLGGGANVLVADKGVRGLVVINDVARPEQIGGASPRPSIPTDTLTVGAGLVPPAVNVAVSSGFGLTVLARKCAAQGIAGLEWAASVPGTIGGAVINNAGAHGGDMAGCVVSVAVLDHLRGGVTLLNADLAYGYRESSLKNRPDRDFVVLSATLRLKADDPAAINARMDEFVAYRKRTQPPGASLGSIFKNPQGDYAGRLIEAAGLKGFQIGGARVSPVHANFFINTGQTTAADYRALILHVQAEVQRQHGITLHPEVEMLGEWDS